MSVVDGREVDMEAVKSRVPQICRDALGQIACPNALDEVDTILGEANRHGYGLDWAYLETRKRVGEVCANSCTQVGIPQHELTEKYQGVELDDWEPLPRLVALE